MAQHKEGNSFREEWAQLPKDTQERNLELIAWCILTCLGIDAPLPPRVADAEISEGNAEQQAYDSAVADAVDVWLMAGGDGAE